MMIQMNDLVIVFVYNFVNSYSYIKLQFKKLQLISKRCFEKFTVEEGETKKLQKHSNLIKRT